jgi:hypothetical protein
MPNIYYDPVVCKDFLASFKARLISKTVTDVYIVSTYEIVNNGRRTIWVVQESKLERPEYFFHFYRKE